MLERLEANRLRQMSERYRITKLLDDLEARSEPRDELLRTMLGSRALALAERASGAVRRGEPAFSREQIRAALDEPADRLSAPFELRRRAREAERDDLVQLRRARPAPAARSTITNRFAIASVSAPHANAASIRPEAQLGRARPRGRRRRSRRCSRRRASAASSPPRPARAGRRPSATSSTSSRYRAALRSASPQSISPPGPSFEVLAESSRRWRSKTTNRSPGQVSPVPPKKAPKKHALRVASARSAVLSAPMPVEPRADLDDAQVLAGVLRGRLQGRRARVAAPAGERLGDPDHGTGQPDAHPHDQVAHPAQLGSQPPARSSAARRASPPGPITVSCRRRAARGEYWIGRTVSSIRPSASISR